MAELKRVLEELKMLAGQKGKENEERRKALTEWLEEHKAGHEKEIEEFMDEWLGEMEEDNEDIKQQALRSQIDDLAYKLIPWSYIAKEYFGKSLSWLTQRVNGYTVRGHVYTLNEEQKQILNRALKEVGEKIGSYRFA